MPKYLHKWLKIPLLLITIASSATIIASCGHKTSSSGKDNGWNTFKALALKETAKNLKTEISNLAQFYWTTSDVAIFSGNGHPKVTKYDQEVIATIVIQDQVSAHSYPINFTINYVGDVAYALTDWSYSQASEINDYDHFKAAVNSETATTLLAKAKLAKNWATLKWYGTNTWKSSDQAEFDVFGGNGGDDTYQGMAGKIKIDDVAESASAIISIKGKEGIYGAFPIQVTITYNSKISYNANSWVFSQITQLQSQKKYVAVLNQESSSIYTKIDNPAMAANWRDFLTNNWLDKEHSTTVGYDWNHAAYSRTAFVVFSAFSANNNNLPNGSGINTNLSIGVYYKRGDSLITNFILNHHFNYIKNVDSKYISVGYCFDYSWINQS